MANMYEYSTDHFPPYAHEPPPTPDLFCTLMRELETEAARQRDQFQATTTGRTPRVDPDEDIFNDQHFCPLSRLMIEPPDFISNLGVPTTGLNQLPSPSKKKRVGADDDDTIFGSSVPSSLVASPSGSTAGNDQESPISPTSISNLSTLSEALSANGVEPTAQASNRPWTHKDETLLLKLFSKRPTDQGDCKYP
ncbi:hypothetical protein EC991_000947 [Linnemannia zychae]|nr:hypothetical protein EC991_000947 [Linnemannia zychae]